jgi:type I restriction enzyme M protein
MGTGAREDAASIPGACGGAAEKGALVSPSWGRVRNALRLAVLVGLLWPAGQARVGAESHLRPRRPVPCAYSPAAHAVGETNSPYTMATKKDERVTDVKQWLKLFEGSALYRHEPSRMFEDYLDLVLCCMSNQRQEERYLQVAKRYTRDELNTMAQLMAYHLLIHEHQVRTNAIGWYDMLGDIYMELSSRSKASRMGQFFTPVELCTVIARITFDGQPEQAAGKSILDPAAGSGRMLLAAHALQPKVSLVAAADLDPICAKMCALNFWLHGIRGEVACMDSLRLSWNWAYHTHPNPTWPFVTYLDDARKDESLLYREAVQVLETAQRKHQQGTQAPDLFTVEDPQSEYGPLKVKYPGVVLLFRVPGSVLVLHDDVATVVQVLQLATPESEALRLPESWLDEVLPRLCKAGYRVAVCDQPMKAA